MEKKINKYSELSKELYRLCSRKELIQRQCFNLGRMECQLLHYISDMGEPICMNELSAALGVSHSRITRIIDTLVRKKYVKRYPSKKDRRSWLAKITDQGQELVDNTTKDFRKIQKLLIQDLPEGKVDEIYDNLLLYMKKYNKILDEHKEEIGR
jgi:DNA-binding MarR family transcriptional regulator